MLLVNYTTNLYKSNKVLAITAYLRGNATVQFKPTLRKYLEKGHANRCKNVVRKVFYSYNKFKRYIKEAFSNLNEERDQEKQLIQLYQVTLAQDYTAKFYQVLAYLKFNNIPLIIYFYKELKDTIKNKLFKED